MLVGRGSGVGGQHAVVGIYRPWLSEGEVAGWISRLLKEKGDFPLFSGSRVQP